VSCPELCSRSTLSCQGLLLPPTSSPCNVVVSSLARQSAVPVKQQSPCPSTLPLGCTDPARKDSLGQPGLHIHLPNSAAVPGRRQLSWPVPLRVQQAVPALQHVLTFYKRETVIFLMVHPIGGELCQLEDIFLQSADTLPFMQRLTMSKAENISLTLASSHPTLPLTSLCLAPLPSLPAGSALSPAGLCRGDAPGHSCLSAVLPTCLELPPSQEPSAAQQHRTSPRHHFLNPL